MPLTVQALLKISMGWMIAFAVLSLGAREVGRTRPSHPALAGFRDGCENLPAPCWHGIIPGITSKEATRAIMTSLGYSGIESAPGFVMNYHTSSAGTPQCIFIGYSAGGDERGIASLEIGCSGLTVGDATSVLGFPAGMRFDRLLSTVYLGFVQPDTGYVTGVTIRPQKLSAYAVVSFINLVPARRRNQEAARWRGFAPIWRYCQLQPEFFGCKR
jgi:hypothetical protein